LGHYEQSPAEGFRRVRALGIVTVNIRGEGKLIQTATNADGIDEVYDLPDGVY
jgi:hypothetical protein